MKPLALRPRHLDFLASDEERRRWTVGRGLDLDEPVLTRLLERAHIETKAVASSLRNTLDLVRQVVTTRPKQPRGFKPNHEHLSTRTKASIGGLDGHIVDAAPGPRIPGVRPTIRVRGRRISPGREYVRAARHRGWPFHLLADDLRKGMMSPSRLRRAAKTDSSPRFGLWLE